MMHFDEYRQIPIIISLNIHKSTTNNLINTNISNIKNKSVEYRLRVIVGICTVRSFNVTLQR